MKRFAFTLERMRNYKDQILDTEKNTLRQLQGERQGVEQAILACDHQVKSLSVKMQKDIRKGVTVPTLRLYDFQLENLRQHREELVEKLGVLERLVERQLGVVVELSQEVSSLDKLEERQLEDYNQQVMKAEELFISELVSGKLARQQTPQ